ncbi:DUF1840 domain-containing protein [Polynucleobacter rarus]|jgi:hypothetical protein|uniref:DUF1840 domain-containing protein n=1 Tax=Polynucleobacter rarus TaxID=556055 RepID=UPI003183586E
MTKMDSVVYAKKMLYKFQSKNSANCLMLEDLTKKIFQKIGKNLEPKGILTVDELPHFINLLESAIEQDVIARSKMSKEQLATSDRLGQRAFPFLTLLKSAHQYQDHIVWGV